MIRMRGKLGKSSFDGFFIFLGVIFFIILISRSSIWLCEEGIACDRYETQPNIPQVDNQQNISPEINDTKTIVINTEGLSNT